MSNKSLGMVTGGGFQEEYIYRKVPVVTGSRRNIYKNFGQIFGASSVTDPYGNPTSATRLIPGVRSGMTYGDFTHNLVTGTLDLCTVGSIIVTDVMNLFLSGSYTPINNYIPLVVWNDVQTGEMGLFISGLGSEDGATPTYDSLNLFIQRNYNNVMPLMLRGELDSVNNTVTLYVSGKVEASSSMMLSIPHVSDVSNNFIPLYLNGF